MHIATISSQRQITLPKALLKHLGASTGDRLLIDQTKEAVTIEKAPKISELAGFLHEYAKYKVPSESEVDSAVQEYVKKTYASKTARSR